ncbi:MAG: outer membrane beta-barrel protein [Steroidobacteraceae bacterium]|nr:outer membrane beta-barrel protein [Steroidobacteraceae bacterium]
MITKKFGAPALLLGSAVFLHAGLAQAEGQGFYFSGGVGQSTMDISKGDLDDELGYVLEDDLGLDILDGGSKLDDSDTALGLTVGYKFSPYLALEVAYLHLGEASYKAGVTVTDGVDQYDLDARITAESKGPALSALGLWPVSDAFDLYARLGVYFGDTDLKMTVSDGVDSLSVGASGSSQDLLYGVGANWNINERWSLRLDYQMFKDVGDEDKTGETDIDMISLGVFFRL